MSKFDGTKEPLTLAGVLVELVKVAPWPRAELTQEALDTVEAHFSVGRFHPDTVAAVEAEKAAKANDSLDPVQIELARLRKENEELRAGTGVVVNDPAGVLTA